MSIHESETLIECILFGLWVALNIANMLTPHYTEYKGFKRAITFCLEVMSMMTSARRRPMLKIPFTYKGERE